MSKQTQHLIPKDSPLALIQEDDQSNLTPSAKLAYCQFYSKKSEAAIDVAMAIPGITEGEPYLFNGVSYEKVDSIGLAGPCFQYFAELDSDYKVTRAQLHEDRGDRKLREAVLAITLAYVGDKVVPALMTFRTTKCKAAKDLVNARSKFADAEFVASQGPIGKQLAQLPTSLRIAGDVDVINRKSRPDSEGQTFSYQIARCRARLLSDVEAQALLTALSDDGFNKAITDLTGSFNSRKATIMEKVV